MEVKNEYEGAGKTFSSTVSKLTDADMFEGGEEQTSREAASKVKGKKRNQLASDSRKGREGVPSRRQQS